ncbi:ATP-binding cassette domain-containing protein [Cohnella mopanensis]|uniref:ATP-binding cassette domain-containing protein n=1 Tax=Cohnella mopanensis TaxID=2911966 RepID=UPI001EF8AD1D|nr:ATP-binding cassette domain-containing protein [Cohnella mopanensis]
MTKSLVTLDHISCFFAHKEVLKDLSLNVHEGEAMAIVGNNGTGKSTLLKIISGLGAINGGRRIEAPEDKRLSIGFAPDRFPKLRFTATEYLRYMGRIRGMNKQRLEERISDLMSQLRLDPTIRQQLRNYSKGMLQKVNLMQALLEKPDLLLLDEPLSGLDMRTQEELMNVLIQIKRQGMTIVLTTHEKVMMEQIADRVVELADGGIASDKRVPVYATIVKEIIFDLGENEMRQCLSDGEGVRTWSRLNTHWRVEISADNSDAFLRSILQAGAAIIKVISLPESPTLGAMVPVKTEKVVVV